MKTALTAAALACAAIAGTAQADFLFPHETNYDLLKPNHTAASTLAKRRDAIAAYYRKWKAAYLKTPTGAGLSGFRYVDGPSTGQPEDFWPMGTKIISGSEHTGYGMLLTVLMEGQAKDASGKVVSEKPDFDGLVATYQRFKSYLCGSGCKLMSWAIPSDFNPKNISDNAPDGDLDIALALLMAHNQWGSAGTYNYLQMAKDEYKAIAKYNLTEHQIPNKAEFRLRVNLGDWSLQSGGDFIENKADGEDFDLDGDGAKTKTFKGLYPYATRPSDWMMGHFGVFARRFNSECVRDCTTHPMSYNEVGNLTRFEIQGLYNDFFKAGSPGVPTTWTKGLISDFVVPQTPPGGTLSNAAWSKENVRRAPDAFIDEPFPTSKWSENAVRVPWRLTWELMVDKYDDTTREWAQRIARFGLDQAHVPESINEYNWSPTGRIGSTYDLNGTRINSFTYFDKALNKTVTKTFGHAQHFASMLIVPLVTLKGQPEEQAAQAALNKGWDYMNGAFTGPGQNPDGSEKDGYFKDSLTLFSMLTVAGLVWFP
ncbi:glycosyl hydrolase family 8 [Piscinibacter terrae]|uniref:cellulase n=1 Tax=Piscinibacter terrae TaxID=2496871 RepID=A0A3N7HQG8_9BURK|nr:glycosyl hydrolase family 8 [Albitalea terrae]RQP23001.1 hypothetical protein DZC73_17880 [Albitalea terrae]